MLINFALYSDDSLNRVIAQIKRYFASNNAIEVVGNVSWFNDWYIEISERMISVNVFNTKSNCEDEIKKFVNNVFAYESVFISNDRYVSKYFKTFTDFSSLDGIFVKRGDAV